MSVLSQITLSHWPVQSTNHMANHRTVVARAKCYPSHFQRDENFKIPIYLGWHFSLPWINRWCASWFSLSSLYSPLVGREALPFSRRLYFNSCTCYPPRFDLGNCGARLEELRHNQIIWWGEYMVPSIFLFEDSADCWRRPFHAMKGG